MKREEIEEIRSKMKQEEKLTEAIALEIIEIFKSNNLRVCQIDTILEKVNVKVRYHSQI